LKVGGSTIHHNLRQQGKMLKKAPKVPSLCFFEGNYIDTLIVNNVIHPNQGIGSVEELDIIGRIRERRQIKFTQLLNSIAIVVCPNVCTSSIFNANKS
ncbi:hypothetical protein RZS08_00380, partial [Arthrospira platensis SPKY1]|nr:hypothetical protein [Arthrospira platensis SPKY1]